MSKIEFRGREYESLADMPAEVRHDYFKARAGYDIPEEEPESNSGPVPAGMESLPGEVREMYENARQEVDSNPVKPSPVDDLPATEDLYRRSAPQGMQDLPSDESIYQPSPLIIEPQPPAIKKDKTASGLLMGLLLAIVVIGIVATVILFTR